MTRANADVLPLSGQTGFFVGMKTASKPLQLQVPGDENEFPRVNTAPQGVETPTQHNWVITDRHRLMGPASVESCHSGHRRGPAESGEV